MGSPSTAAHSSVSTQSGPVIMGRRLVGYGIALLAALGIVVAAGDVLGPQYPWLVRFGVALCLAAQALVIVECLRPRRLLWPITALAALGVLAIGGGLLLHPDPIPGLEWRTNIWLGPVLQFLILLHPRRRAWPLLSVVSLTLWAAVTVVHQLNWRIQVLDLVFTLTPVATLGIGGACITTLLMELRLSQLRRIHDEQEERRTQMQEQERRERIRLAHDSLLHTLQRISGGWDRPTAAETSALAAAATHDLEASSESLGDGEWVALLTHLEAAIADEGCDVVWRGRDLQVPLHVARAIAGAAREAIRNVVKHARCSAIVTVNRMGSGCRVTIVDDGPGFDAGARPAGHLGIDEGIVGRMTEAGGSATISSGSLGSTVKLEWATEPFKKPEAFGPVARTLISWLPVPVLIASLVHVALFEVGPSALGVAVLWVTTAVICVLFMWQLRTSGLTWWQPAALTALAMALLVANYLWLPAEGTNGYHVWTPSLAGALMVLALPGRRLGQAIAMSVGVIVVTVVACVSALGWDVALATQLGSIMAVVMYVLAPLALATGASVVANHARGTEELHAAKRLSAELSAERDATRREWVTRMLRLAGPFLSDAAHATEGPTNQQVVHGRIIEARLRDELVLWPHGTIIADRAHALREEGWECTVDALVAAPVEQENLLKLMSHLPTPLPGQHLHLTLRKGDAVATITEPPFSMEQRHHLDEGLHVLHDEDFTQLRVTATPALLEEAR